MAKKKNGGTKDAESQRERLRRELAEAAEEIDEEGLLFLLEQARVLIHNAHVEQLQREADEITARKRHEPPAAARTAPAPGVSIDASDDGKSFFLVSGSTRKILTRDELRMIARVCHDAESESEARERLHRVLRRERRDILTDLGIGSPSNALLDAVYREVRSKYRPRE